MNKFNGPENVKTCYGDKLLTLRTEKAIGWTNVLQFKLVLVRTYFVHTIFSWNKPDSIIIFDIWFGLRVKIVRVLYLQNVPTLINEGRSNWHRVKLSHNFSFTSFWVTFSHPTWWVFSWISYKYIEFYLSKVHENEQSLNKNQLLTHPT